MEVTPYKEVHWIVSEVIIIVVVIYLFHLLSALLYYAWRYRPSTKIRLLFYFAVVSVVLAIGRCISDEIVAFVGWKYDEVCRISVSVSIVLFQASFTSVYLFLWLRQYFLYSRPFVKRLKSKGILYLNFATLIILTLSGISLAILFQIPSITGWKYKATTTGCRDVNDSQDFELTPFLALVVSSIGKLILLGLLLYPLMAARKRKQKLLLLSAQSNKSVVKSENQLLRLAIIGSHNENQRQQQFSNSFSPKKNLKENETSFRGEQQNDPGDDDVFLEKDCHLRLPTQHLISGTVYSSSDTDSDNPSPSAGFSRKEKFEKKTKKKIYSKRKSRRESMNKNRINNMENTGSQIVRKSSSDASRRPRNANYNMKLKRTTELTNVMKKLFFLTLFCVLSDAVTTVIEMVFVAPEFSYLVLYDVNLALNITCIVLSFRDWRMMITFPCCWRRQKLKPKPISELDDQLPSSSRIVTNKAMHNETRAYDSAEDDAVSIQSIVSSKIRTLSGSWSWRSG